MKTLKTIKIAKSLHVTHSAVSQWFQGKTKPTADKMFQLEDRFGIPVQAWRDIKSYLKEHSNKTTENNSNMETTKKVS